MSNPTAMPAKNIETVWRRRLDSILSKVAMLFCVALLYVASELVIWGISHLLSPVNCEYFSSILGMTVVFLSTTVIVRYLDCVDALYQKHLKPLVDWINSQMGVGFVVPLIILHPSEIISGVEICQIIANFVLTNAIFWPFVYYASLYILELTAFLVNLVKAKNAAKGEADTTQRPLQDREPPSPTENDPQSLWDSSPTSFTLFEERKTSNRRHETSDRSSPEDTGIASLESGEKHSVSWHKVALQYPSILAFVLMLVVGVPIAAVTGDSRALDVFGMWLFWISAVRGQRLFKQSKLLRTAPHWKSAISTLMNPVLVTVFLMLAYTRVKSAASGVSVSEVLDEFSQGTPAYALWTAGASGDKTEYSQTSYFGAGDLALSILEVGILIWGFKLYECRRQLFSGAGVVTILVSIAAAAANVYLCVIFGVLVQLKTPEALAFAARSTTLALAKPATEAVGGNVPANAGLVVANGILGQLLYPFILARMGVKEDVAPTKLEQGDKGEQKILLPDGQGNVDDQCSPPQTPPVPLEEADDAITIAAGISIGVNGAALGVAYLVENKSRAAPYAALAMTVFGVFTVVFTTMEPFTNGVINLAEYQVYR